MQIVIIQFIVKVDVYYLDIFLYAPTSRRI